MHRIETTDEGVISYEGYGDGPPLLLVHGSFSDHRTNWEFVKPLFERQFTVFAIARRGRGETTATQSRSVAEEAADVVALLEAIAEPAFLLGHSHGAQVALAATARKQAAVRKLVLYEPPWPRILSTETMAQLERLAAEQNWDEFAITFFGRAIRVPIEELRELQRTEFWPPIIADAPATLGDLRALSRYAFDADSFREIQLPVLLQIGTESHRDLYVTDALARVLQDARIEELPGQAHEAMTTAPDMYACAVARFLLGLEAPSSKG